MSPLSDADMMNYMTNLSTVGHAYRLLSEMRQGVYEGFSEVWEGQRIVASQYETGGIV